jgi:hypothetical protein
MIATAADEHDGDRGPDDERARKRGSQPARTAALRRPPRGHGCCGAGLGLMTIPLSKRNSHPGRGDHVAALQEFAGPDRRPVYGRASSPGRIQWPSARSTSTPLDDAGKEKAGATRHDASRARTGSR